jgi:hypothetical protein
MFEELPTGGRGDRGLRLRLRRIFIEPVVLAAELLTGRSAKRTF